MRSDSPILAALPPLAFALMACGSSAPDTTPDGSSPASGSDAATPPDSPSDASSTPDAGTPPTDGAVPTADASLPGWTLTWSDEFNTGTQPEPSKWNYDLGDGTEAGAPGWGNNELESYTKSPDNVAVAGGNLVITARVNTDSSLRCATCDSSGNKCTYAACGYTSGRIQTQGKFSQTYGRFEARIKIPVGSGVWPAFWTMGEPTTQANWPQYGEIDVMENAGSSPSTIQGTIHGPGGTATYTDEGLSSAYNLPDGGAFGGDFHVFAIEWAKGTISFFCDSAMYFTVTTADVAAVGGGATWPFDNNPNFILFDFAVDSGNFGNPPNAKTTWPQQMLVDYVRVYQKQ